MATLAALVVPYSAKTFGGITPTPPSIGPSDSSTPLPELSSDEVGKAESLVANDRVLKDLTAVTPFSVSQVGVWHIIKDPRKLGAVLELTSSAPVTLTGMWPVMHYDKTETTTPPYTVSEIPMTVANVSSLLVAVDLDRSVIVSIQPGPGSKTLSQPATSNRVSSGE